MESVSQKLVITTQIRHKGLNSHSIHKLKLNHKTKDDREDKMYYYTKIVLCIMLLQNCSKNKPWKIMIPELKKKKKTMPFYDDDILSWYDILKT